jgi:hypothetical protein
VRRGSELAASYWYFGPAKPGRRGHAALQVLTFLYLLLFGKITWDMLRDWCLLAFFLTILSLVDTVHEAFTYRQLSLLVCRTVFESGPFRSAMIWFSCIRIRMRNAHRKYINLENHEAES